MKIQPNLLDCYFNSNSIIDSFNETKRVFLWNIRRT